MFDANSKQSATVLDFPWPQLVVVHGYGSPKGKRDSKLTRVTFNESIV
jgi:hypothetical protein